MKKKLILFFMLLVVPFIYLDATEIDEGEMPIVIEENGTMSIAEENDGLLIAQPESEIFYHSKFAVSDNINTNYDVYGILFAAAENVTINGYNQYGLYAGNNVIIKGNIESDTFIAGNNIYINETATIGRDAYIAGNYVEISGSIGGDIKIYASSVNINKAVINGNVEIDSENISINEDTSIYGTLKYNDDANVEGIDKEKFSNIIIYENESENGKVSGIYNISSSIYGFISLLIIAVVINCLFPKIYKNVNKKVTTSSVFKSMGSGLIIFVVIPVLSIILMCTYIAAELAVILLVLYLVCLSLSLLPVAAVIGNQILTKLFKKKDNNNLSMILGLLVIEIITLIPCLGTLLTFLLIFIGLDYIKKLIFKK